ncbi:MAG: IclR family transcriptional regulator [Comamonas sp.]|uniref:IclR family transcriptional regulator n=1 Tax=Comamonas sp. TaxID=34028 RepID=UPI002FCA7176
MSPIQATAQAGTQSLRRTVQLLRELTHAGERGASAGELAQRCDLTRATTYRLLATLTQEGLAVHAAGVRRYFLGPFAYEMGLQAFPQLGLRELCAGVVSGLARQTGECVFLVMRSGLDTLCLDRQSGAFAVEAMPVDIGSRRPLGVGLSSIAILAALPEAEREAIMRANGMRYQETGRLAAERIRLMVKRTADRRFAFTASDYIDNVGGFALPIRRPSDGVPFAALSIASGIARMKPPRGEEIVPLLESAIHTIESRL